MIGMAFSRLQNDLSATMGTKMRADAVDLLFNTAPALYGYQFGHDRKLFDALVGAAWEQADNLFSHRCAGVALDADRLVGLIVGCHGHQFRSFSRNLGPLWTGMVTTGQVPADLMAVLNHNGPYCSYLTPKIPDKAFYVLGLSVDPACHGRGLGVRLLHLAESRAASEGATSLHLDVLSDNHQAIKFYSAMGLQCVAETRSPEAHRNGVPMMMRLVKGLV